MPNLATFGASRRGSSDSWQRTAKDHHQFGIYPLPISDEFFHASDLAVEFHDRLLFLAANKELGVSDAPPRPAKDRAERQRRTFLLEGRQRLERDKRVASAAGQV